MELNGNSWSPFQHITQHEIGEKYDKTPAQVALNWLVFQDSVIPIAGCKNSEQIRQNIGAIGWEMTQEEFNQLEQITRPWLNWRWK